jgi:hypothetical protein
MKMSDGSEVFGGTKEQGDDGTLEDITITKDKPLVIENNGKDPLIKSYGIICLKPEGRIECSGPVVIRANKFINTNK